MTQDRDEIAEAFERTTRRLKTEGLEAATDAALKLLKDEKAPAQAKSATINAVYRAAGLFDRGEVDNSPEPHAMTAAELDRAVRKSLGILNGLTPGEGDIFE